MGVENALSPCLCGLARARGWGCVSWAGQGAGPGAGDAAGEGQGAGAVGRGLRPLEEAALLSSARLQVGGVAQRGQRAASPLGEVDKE